MKGRDFVPDYALAQSTELRADAFPVYDCTLQEALQYLRMEPFNVKGIPHGYALVRFEQLALGWIKYLGNRSNNLLPKELRIRNS